MVKADGLGRSSLITSDNSKRIENFKKYKRAYDKVPLIAAIIDVQADQAVQEFYFEGPNAEKLTDLSNTHNFMMFFHQVAKSMLLFGNAYVEIVKKGEEIEELKVLDPVWIDVWREKTGEVIGYSQSMNNSDLVLWGTTGDQNADMKFMKKVSSFDSIAHFKHNVINIGETYGRSAIASLMHVLQIKLDMEEDLKHVLFKYVAPLIWAKVGSDSFPANQDVVDEISNTLRDLQAESEITTSHLVDLQVLDFNAKGMDIQTPLKHIEQQIITGGQVPPVLLGRTEKMDRSQADVQLRNHGRHIKALQRELSFEFETKFIVGQSLGSEQDKIVWGRAEEREWEADIDILRGLVTDGILTPQKANDLLPPRFRETLPDPFLLGPNLNQQTSGEKGQQVPRANQMQKNKLGQVNNPHDPTKTTKNKAAHGRRIQKGDKFVGDKRDKQSS